MDVLFVSDLSVDQPSVSLYDLSNGVQLKCIKNTSCQHNGYAFVNNDIVLIAQHSKQTIHVQETYKDQLIKRIVCPDKITCLCVSPDGCYCVVGLMEKLYIWQLGTGDLLNILTKHYQKVNAIRFTSDGSFFISCGDDGAILIWDLARTLQPIDTTDPENVNGQPFHSITLHSLPVKDVFISSNGSRSVAVSASLDKTCAIFDISSGEILCQLTIGIACCSVTMDVLEHNLYTGTKTGKIFMVNLLDEKGKEESDNTIDAHSKDVHSLCLSMDSNILVSASADGNVKVWDTKSKQCLRLFSFKGEVTNVAFLRFPQFLNKNYKQPKFTTPIGNFKRVVSIPSYKIFQATSHEELAEETTPVILKDVRNSDAYKFYHAHNINNNTSLIMEQLGRETKIASETKKSLSSNLKNASRKELLEKIEDFTMMSNEFYKFAKDKLLTKCDSMDDT